MPDSMSVERRRLLAAYGAELILTPGGLGMRGSVDRSLELLDSIPGAFMPGQFTNPANPLAHYRTTGPEIVQAMGGVPTAFVAGVGTGGTVSGVGRYLKEKDGATRIVAAEPAESAIISQRIAGETLTPGPHIIQGIGANFIPDTLDLDVLDDVYTVKGEDAIVMARRLAAEEGIMAGISSGANVVAALRLAAEEGMQGGTVVTVAPSTGERYLTTALWEGLA
jgi:cysteine synthase A